MNTNRGSKWTEEQLAEHIYAAGIRNGDRLIIHSSLRALGPTEDGAKTVLGAFKQVLGKTGTLMVPTFTYSLPMWNYAPFNLAYSISQTGAFTEYLRSQPEARRSFHPTHSVVVIGNESDEIAANHQSCSPLGLGSPFHKMVERGARILMLGTRQDTNSSLHLVEVLADVPYLNIGFTAGSDHELAWFISDDGSIAHHEVREIPGCSRGFPSIQSILYDRQVIEDVTIGNAASQLMNSRTLCEVGMEILSERPGALLCQLPNCAICPRRRKHLSRLGYAPEMA